MTAENAVTSAGRLVGRCLSMEDVIDVWIHETSMQVQVLRYSSQELDKNFGGSG